MGFRLEQLGFVFIQKQFNGSDDSIIVFFVIGFIVQNPVDEIVIIHHFFPFCRCHFNVIFNAVVELLIGGVMVTISPSSVMMFIGSLNDFKNVSRCFFNSE
jgi:hypothetical protein